MHEGAASAATERVRAGSRALSIFAYSLNARVLRAHADGPLRPGELEERIGWAPQSSLRSAVCGMCDLDALARHEPADGTQNAVTELTEAGRDLLPVASALERWLGRAPDGAVQLDDAAARGIVRVLTAGWDSTVVRTLAERPLTLTEMNAGIVGLSYPALKRRVAKLRSTRLVTTLRSGNAAAYAASDWLRLSIFPLAVAGRWEGMHGAEPEPITQVEVEAAFLLTLPLLQLPGDTTGTCTLAVLAAEDQDGPPDAVGVTVEVEEGRIVSCSSGGAAAPPTTWALGTADAWLDAVIDGQVGELRVSGPKSPLAHNLVMGIHDTFFRS